ncbi:hypothetical protein SNEBB_004387 [Seison nebaliae]|nr:hypothetical protein SNEBB_004387 [Seison nebaliae]
MLCKIIFLNFFVLHLNQAFNWHNCGKNDNPIKFQQIEISPDPVVQPGNVKARIVVQNDRPLSGVISLHVNVVRTIAGLSVPIGCFHIDGKPVGSCVYPDVCDFMQRIFKLYPNNCPDNLKEYGIDCSCPLTGSSTGVIDTQEFSTEIPKFGKILSWLASGHYNVTAMARNEFDEEIACLQIGVNMIPAEKVEFGKKFKNILG